MWAMQNLSKIIESEKDQGMATVFTCYLHLCLRLLTHFLENEH